jgi:putative tricarboxylic transport membrane protein
MLETIIAGLSYLATPGYWGAVFAGVLISAAVGLIPGVGTPIVMAITVPFVVFGIQDPLVGIVLLATIGGVANTLDSIPAVLLGYPGAATQVTFLEGHQLAQRGRAAHTLGAVYAVSALGGLVGAVVLVIVIPVIRPFILQFSYPEIAAMALFGVAMVSVLSRGAMLKGMSAGMIGILLSAVGTHWNTATERFTFGTMALLDGLPLIAITLGIFALPEVLDLCATGRPVAAKGSAVISNREVLAGARDGLRRWPMTIRQSLFGVFLGTIPGIGSSVIDWLAYAFGISLSKDKRQFGKGSLEGVLFAESAQNAKEGGQAIPTLAFGVPGGLAWVFVLAAMLSYGIAPGPQMLGRHADITIMLAVSFAIGNLLVTLIGLGLTGQLAKLTTIPYVVIGAIIIPVSFLSAFQESGGWFGILILLVFTPIGLAMKAFQWPRPPLILGFILGGVIESNLQSALSAYGIVGVLTRPITVALLLIALATVVLLLRLDSQSKPSGAAAGASERRRAVVRPGQLAVAAALPAGGSGDAGPSLSSRTGSRPARRRLASLPGGAWKLEHGFALLIVLIAGAVLWASLAFPPRARFLPLLASGTIMLLTLVHLLCLRKPGSGQIMDIGLRSLSVPGAGRYAMRIAGFIGLLMLLTATIGLKHASIAFAVLFPIVMMDGKARWIASAIGALLVALIAIGLLDYYMAVYWPDPVLWHWITGRL